MSKIFTIILCVLLTSGCANPLNRATSDRYARTCNEEKMKGQLDAAEEACYRALVNVDWGNLGPELKSQRLYNLALVKRGLAKFQEAEDLLKQSIAIEENLVPPSSVRIGRRQVELAVNLAGQGKWEEGTGVLGQVLITAEHLEGQERAFTAEVLRRFAEELRKRDQPEVASRFEKRASELAK